MIGEADRRGTPAGLYWPWAAATVSVLGISYGALALGFGIDPVQAVLVAVIGTVISCLLCGIIAIAGQRGSAPTLVLSRAAFGVTGNKVPAVVLALIAGAGVLGYDAVMRLQTWIMYISIVLTVVYIALTWHHVDFSALGRVHAGSSAAVIGAVIFLMAGGGSAGPATSSPSSRAL